MDGWLKDFNRFGGYSGGRGRGRLRAPRRMAGVVAIGLALAVALWWGVSFRTDLENVTQPRSEVMAGRVTPGKVYGQSFVAPYEGLHSISVRFGTFGKRNDCRLTFRLYDMQAAFELVRSYIACGDLHDNVYYTFTFPAIENSAGRAFLFSVESTDATDEQSVAVWATPAPDYAAGEFFLNFQPRNGDLTFRSAYRVSLSTVLSIYVDPLTRLKPGVYGELWFYPVLLAAYLFAAAALIRLAARMRL